VTQLEAAFTWDAHRPTDARDHAFADALADPPPDPAAALLGVPYDGAVIGRRGAREGPRALRRALAPMKTCRVTPGPGTVHAVDRGDVPLDENAPVPEAHEAVREAAAALRIDDAVPVGLGGDHSLTYPLARPHAEAHGRLGVVNVDAHLDVREVEDVPNSGSSFGRLLRDDLVDGAHLVEVGPRDFATSSHYVDWARDRGATLVPADDVPHEEPGQVLRTAYEGPLADVDAVYVSLDVDALDQAHGPGVSAPTPRGLTTTQFAAQARTAIGARPAPRAGGALVETAPPHDPTDRTARAAARAAAEVLAALSGGPDP
jgi:formimidoylglutamase